MMEKENCMLTAEQYNELYCKAFARLDDVVRLAERAMAEAGRRSGEEEEP